MSWKNIVYVASATAFIIALLALLASHTPAAADEQPKLAIPQSKITCEMVRAFVAVVGEAKAEMMAREQGAKDGKINSALKCLASRSKP